MSTLPAPTIRIREDQVQFFRENGYLAIDRITTDEELDRMRTAYDRIFEQQAGRDEGLEFDLAGTDEEGATATLPQILNPKKFAPELNHTLYEANALSIARQLLGAACNGGGSHAIFKPARYGAATPWHQDEAYWQPDRNYLSLSAWMPLQQATLENGCMQFIPGTHTTGVFPHHHIGDNPKIHGLEIDPGHVDLSRAVACPMPAGGATFHYSRTLHYTGPNNSDIPRRAFILGFGIPLPPRNTPRDFHWQRVTDTYAAKKRAAAQNKK